MGGLVLLRRQRRVPPPMAPWLSARLRASRGSALTLLLLIAATTLLADRFPHAHNRPQAPVFAVALAGATGVAAAVLLMSAGPAADRRDAELRLLRSRGAGLPGLVGRVAAEAAVCTTLGSALGLSLALALLPTSRWAPSVRCALAIWAAATLALPLRALARHRGERLPEPPAARHQHGAAVGVTGSRRQQRTGRATTGAHGRVGTERDRPAHRPDPVIACDRLVRTFARDGVEVQALRGLDLTVAQGEMTALVGASGSGKSTLLRILAGLDLPTAGRATVAGRDLSAMSAGERPAYRREAVGFVRQQTSGNLLPFLTARQNVSLPMQLTGGRGRGLQRIRADRAGGLLDLLGVGHCANRRPEHLSGGEQQRVAIAVALANDPSVLLADEPAGALDAEAGALVFEALRTVNRELGTTVVIVTHDPTVAGEVRRTVEIRDGLAGSELLRRPVGDAGGVRSGGR